MAVRAVIFDFGGVIVTSPFEAFTRYERDNGLPEGFLRRLNATDPDSNAWARLERSEVDHAEFAELFEAEARAGGREIDGRAVLALLVGEIRPAMVDALRRCHDRLKTALLTNNFALPDARGGARPEGPMAELADLFDVVIESSNVGLRKPDTAIYQLVCRELGVAPREAVFLDDLGVNLKPARAMGMTTIKVDRPDEALAELEQVVGFPLR
ncbi:MAG: HAD-IA family hydrolase [Acidimicrobiales bacterium]